MLKENNKEKNDEIIKIEEKNKKLPKGISQGILKNILKNLIVAIFIMAYFITLNILYMHLQENILLGTVKICATALLVAGIIIIEIAYKKDNGTLAITGIEVLILSMHSLFINQLDIICQSPVQTIKFLDRSFNADAKHAIMILDYIY